MNNANDDVRPVEDSENVEYEPPTITPLGSVAAVTLLTAL